MNDDQPASGSRWEPTEGTTAVQEPVAPVAPGPARPGRRRRALVAAVAAGLLLVGGAGGFAIGHATAAPGAPTAVQADRDGGPGGFRGPGRGSPGDADDDAPDTSAVPDASGTST